MDLNKLVSEKKERATIIKKELGLLQKNKALGLIKVTDKTIIKDLRDGLIILPANFVIEITEANNEKLGNNIVATSKIEKSDLVAFDFVICDNDVENLNSYFEKGVTAIVNKDTPLKSLLKEYNALKSEGNCFYYNEMNKWGIYYGLVKYLENFKFPFDNKKLVENVTKI